MCVPRGGVHTKSEESDHVQCEPISPVLAFSLGDLDRFHVLFRVSIEKSNLLVRRSIGVSYAGCFHAGPVTRMLGKSFGGSKYSFNCVRRVVEKFLFVWSGGSVETWQVPQVLSRGNFGPWMKACRVCEIWAVDCPLAIVAITGLETDIWRGCCNYLEGL